MYLKMLHVQSGMSMIYLVFADRRIKQAPLTHGQANDLSGESIEEGLH